MARQKFGSTFRGIKSYFKYRFQPRNTTGDEFWDYKHENISVSASESTTTSAMTSFNEKNESKAKYDEDCQPKSLWQAAFDQLDAEKQRILMSRKNFNSAFSDEDETASDIESVLNGVINTVKQQYEVRQLKRQETWLGTGSKKILNAALAIQGHISAVMACDPNGQASSAWAVVSFGLKMTQNYRNQQSAWFESSEFLSDTLSRITLIEVNYRGRNSATKDGVENALIQTYLAILNYSAEVMKIHQSNAGGRVLQSITAMIDLPLTSIKTSIQNEELRLEKWINVQRDLDCNEKADSILAEIGQVLTVVQNIDENIELAKLPVAERASFGSYTPEPEPECLPDTRVDLIQSIEDWVDDPHGKPLFWLNGMAGTGKSTISRTLARSMQDRGLLGASFFFNRSEKDRANSRKLVPTIFRQLVHVLPQLRKDIRDVTDFGTAAIAVQFEKLLLQPLSNIKTCTGQKILLVVVIDALDECEDTKNVQAIIQLLPQLQNPASAVELRFLLTSRPELPVNLGFRKVTDKHHTTVLHDIDQAIVERDISTFFKDRLSKVREARELACNWPGENKIQALIAMAVPLFIYAATICRVFEDDQWHPDSSLKEILEHKDERSQMAGTYLPVLNKLLIGQTDRKKIQLAKEIHDVVGAIIILEDPLPVTSLVELIDIPKETVETRVRSLPSVLRVPERPEEPVRLFHQSFRDFLLDASTHDESQFWVDGTQMNRKMAYNCLRVMGREHGGLRRNICNLKSHGSLRTEIDNDMIKAHLPKELQYACRNWVNHFQQGKSILDDHDSIHEFLRKHFLHWVEAMSILGYVSEAVSNIDTLQSIIENQTESDLSTFLQDAKRFVLRSTGIIEVAPLQLYSSALAFAPQKSIVRNGFQAYLPRCLSQLPIVESHWGAVLQTIEGDMSGFRTVAFSPDNQLVASGSKEGMVKLWNTGSGTLQQELRGHSSTVCSVAFSPSGELLASGSVDFTVKVWNIASGLGVLQETFEGHSKMVHSVAFSPDGRLLASASFESTIRLWNLDQGKIQQTLQGPELALAVAFSPDGKMLASAFQDDTVWLWSMGSDPITLSHTLETPTSTIISIAFSPDSKFIIAGCSDGSVNQWNVAQGSIQHIFTGHFSAVNSVAYSPDGKSIISGSGDHTIKLWDTSSGNLKQSLSGHCGGIETISLSTDGKLLASGSHDDTMRIWDLSSRALQQDPSPRYGYVALVLFSPDSKHVVSSTVSGIIVWDPFSGQIRYTFEAAIAHAGSVVFSNDSSILTAGSRDGAVRVWDTSSDELLSVFQGHTESITSVAVSLDNTIIASGSGDKTVQLWHLRSGAALRTIQNGERLPLSLAFSHDNTLLATAYDDGTIGIWNSTSGTLQYTLRDHHHPKASYSSVVFSLDTRLLAAGCRDGTVKLWNVASDTITHTIDVGQPVTHLSFSEDGTYLKTNWDSYHITTDDESGGVSSSNIERYIAVDEDKQWLRCRGEKVLWLPPEYRPTYSVVQDDVVALGHASGRVSFVGFNMSAGGSPV